MALPSICFSASRRTYGAVAALNRSDHWRSLTLSTLKRLSLMASLDSKGSVRSGPPRALGVARKSHRLSRGATICVATTLVTVSALIQ